MCSKSHSLINKAFALSYTHHFHPPSDAVLESEASEQDRLRFGTVANAEVAAGWSRFPLCKKIGNTIT